jgi:hypothetical protein
MNAPKLRYVLRVEIDTEAGKTAAVDKVIEAAESVGGRAKITTARPIPKAKESE